MDLALKVLESASWPIERPCSRRYVERDDASWMDFSNIEQMSDEEIARRRAEFDRNKQIMRKSAA